MPAPRRSPRQKRQDAADREARLHAALAWPSDPEPAALTPEECAALLRDAVGNGSDRIATAWTFTTAYEGEVLLGCFSNSNHSKRSSTKTTTQTQGGPWYRSPSDAAKAMHWAIARECAARLVRVEDKIADLRTDITA